MKFKITKKSFYKKYIYKIVIPMYYSYFIKQKDYKGFKKALYRDYRETITSPPKNRYGNTFLGLHYLCETTLSHKSLLYKYFQIINLLENSKDFKFSYSWEYATIYTNDENLINSLADLLNGHVRSVVITRPKNDKIAKFLLENPNKIVHDTDHCYKVTLRTISEKYSTEFDNFVLWAEKTNNVKIRRRHYDHTYRYFYIDDAKSISLCQLYIGHLIQRIEEFVSEDSIA